MFGVRSLFGAGPVLMASLQNLSCWGLAAKVSLVLAVCHEPLIPHCSLSPDTQSTRRVRGARTGAEEASSSGPGQKSSGTRKEEEEDDGERKDRRAAGPQRVGVRGKA